MDLIEKDTLLEAMKKRKDYVGRASDPVCLVEDAPTVDAVPVVRCKDCKYLIQTVFFGNKMNACRRYGSSTIFPTARIVVDDWYCADGERWKDADATE